MGCCWSNPVTVATCTSEVGNQEVAYMKYFVMFVFVEFNEYFWRTFWICLHCKLTSETQVKFYKVYKSRIVAVNSFQYKVHVNYDADF